jgi:hypothetical protein
VEESGEIIKEGSPIAGASFGTEVDVVQLSHPDPLPMRSVRVSQWREPT